MPNLLNIVRGNNLWQQVDPNLYNQLPIYLTKNSVEYQKWFSRWPKLLKGINWTPNMGTTMRGVRKVRGPILRSTIIPQLMTAVPRKDIIEVRETTEDVHLYRHDFESDMFHFIPSFFDFLNDHVSATLKDINEKVAVFSDMFYRTAIFHGSPNVWVCGNTYSKELQGAPYWTGGTIAESKGAGTLQQWVANANKPLGLKMLSKIATVMQNDLNALPFTGGVLPDGSDGSALTYKYCLVAGSEVWEYFAHDPDIADYKSINLDLVTGRFRGSLFGQWTCLPERFELRIAADGTMPAPETIEENPDAYNEGETIMNPAYVDAPWGVAFAVGGEAYKYVKIGPPPTDWNKTTPQKLRKMLDWNGQVAITDDLLVPTSDSDGNTVNDTNKRGEYLQLIASLALGIAPIQRRNIVPIVYLRARVQP